MRRSDSGLEQLATEVDRLNAVKKANEENLKLAEYVANLQRENANASALLTLILSVLDRVTKFVIDAMNSS
ncbi:hypothetical protein, partial [Cronobacter sakazakii]|uniref:hypothetical protein n=1 Tax=Cronobacter sakazakii TaxID=28141 RepID=UPI001F349D67